MDKMSKASAGIRELSKDRQHIILMNNNLTCLGAKCCLQKQRELFLEIGAAWMRSMKMNCPTGMSQETRYLHHK